jgi:glutamyl-tRNA reductase
VIVVVGLSHRDAPIEVRERVAIDRDDLPGLLRVLASCPSVSEVLCVSTCNRLEVYAAAKEASDGALAAAARDVSQVLSDLGRKNGVTSLAASLQTEVGDSALRHLFRVASSLDSLVVGEPQILGQVKEAFEIARQTGTTGRLLERAMSRAFHVAKRVRSETSIGSGQVSVSSVAVDLARQIFDDLGKRTVLLLGAGEMAEAAAKLLLKSGSRLVVVNRSLERAAELAREFGGTARPWEELEAAMVGADVVIASTAARGFVITRAMIARAMKARRGRSLFFIDIALPRDVEPSANDLDNVYLYDIDNLSQIVSDSLRKRESEAAPAEALVSREAESFAAWAETRNVTGTIVALRAKVRASLLQEVDRTLSGRLRHLPDTDRKALEVMVDAAVNKLLHTPVTRIKALASDPRGEDLVKALHHLFDLPSVIAEPPAAAPEEEGVREEVDLAAASGGAREPMGR